MTKILAMRGHNRIDHVKSWAMAPQAAQYGLYDATQLRFTHILG